MGLPGIWDGLPPVFGLLLFLLGLLLALAPRPPVFGWRLERRPVDSTTASCLGGARADEMRAAKVRCR